MWILPKNYPLSSHFAADMLESKEDLSLPGLNIEQSLMWRSSPSPLRTWLQRWKRVGWFQHLSGRILKPSQHKSLETKLMSSLLGIHVNHSVQQEGGREKTIQDIFGLSSENTSQQLDLFGASLKMSKDTSALDSEMCLKIWQDSVISQRGEYSARLKLAHHIREKESLSWPTPNTSDSLNANLKPGKDGVPHDIKWRYLRGMVQLMPTPSAIEATKYRMRGNSQASKSLSSLARQGKLMPTPASRDWKGGYAEKSLTRRDGKSRRFDLLPNAAIGGVGTDIVPGHLNPTWVEWLQGVETGWTELGSWGTELSPKQQQKRGAS